MIRYNIIFFISTIIATFLHIICYKELSNYGKIKVNKKKILIFVFISFILALIANYKNGLLKPLLSCICLLVCLFFIFEEPLNKIISYGVFEYAIAIICELFMSIILICLDVSVFLYESNIILKCFFSIFVLLIVYLLCRINLLKKIGNRFSLLINKSKLIVILLIIFMMVPILLDARHIRNMSVYNCIISIVLSIIFEFIISILLVYEIKSNNEIQKYENLLKFLAKYEKIIDEQRSKRHEIHNNLLILKSYKNKNSKEFNEILDSLLDNYSKTEDSVKNMYKLPNGIKGIVYYKLMNIDKNIIHLNVNISKKINFKIEKNNNKEYISLCKILGIILDNAIESCKESKEKILNVDMYCEDKKIIFVVANTYNKKKTNFDKICELNYSTKGKCRGYGLPIANKILSASKCIIMRQYIEKNYFFTEIKVDN